MRPGREYLPGFCLADMGVVFDYSERRSPFCVWFEVVDEDLAVGDLVTVTIMKSEVQDG